VGSDNMTERNTLAYSDYTIQRKLQASSIVSPEVSQ
jgi:hypothetical protein